MTIVICFAVDLDDFDLIPLNDLSRWTSADREAIQLAIVDVVNSGNFIGGPQTRLLEQKLRKLVHGYHIVCVGNGTDALILSLLALGVGSGDLVATVANAGGYETSAILQTGATPILFEDCAQSIGAKLNGILAGAFGDASTFSFYPTKNPGCLGDAGAVAMKSYIHAELLRSPAHYDLTARYVVDYSFCMNSRIDEIQAAVLNMFFESLEGRNRVRREIIRQFQSSLK